MIIQNIYCTIYIVEFEIESGLRGEIKMPLEIALDRISVGAESGYHINMEKMIKRFTLTM